MTYEPHILEEFARRLYKQAEELTAQYVLGGIFGGGLFGGIVGFGIVFADHLMNSKTSPGVDVMPGFALICAVLVATFGGVVGFYSAKEKAFELKFKAQQTLCQVQIEKNTRKGETGTQGLQSVTT